MQLIAADGSIGVERVKAFYEEFLDAPNDLRHVAKDMLSLLDKIHLVNSVVDSLYWSTSHLTLCLSKKRDESSVTIESNGVGSMFSRMELTPGGDEVIYAICYRMRTVDAPWPGAWVQLQAKSVLEACSILEVAFARCLESAE